jgi:hypothetical protein
MIVVLIKSYLVVLPLLKQKACCPYMLWLSLMVSLMILPLMAGYIGME